MKFFVFAISFGLAFLVVGKVYSDCLYRCRQNVDANYFVDLATGNPPLMTCVHYPDTRGGMLYTDLSNGQATMGNGWLVLYRQYHYIECHESCWHPNGPANRQDAVYHGAHNSGEISWGYVKSYYCRPGGTHWA